MNTKIKSVIIPSSVIRIVYPAFALCSDLKIVEIEEKSRLKLENCNLFECSEFVMIPPKEKQKFISEEDES